jgi:hypothetical protein
MLVLIFSRIMASSIQGELSKYVFHSSCTTSRFFFLKGCTPQNVIMSYVHIRVFYQGKIMELFTCFRGQLKIHARIHLSPAL